MNELEERAWKIYCHEIKPSGWARLLPPLKKIYLAKAANEPLESVGSFAGTPKYKPRRPYLDDEPLQPDGLFESDRDYLANNLDLAVKLLDKLAPKDDLKFMYQDEGLGYEEEPPPSGSYS
jgi:hypothetical protein